MGGAGGGQIEWWEIKPAQAEAKMEEKLAEQAPTMPIQASVCGVIESVGNRVLVWATT